MENDSQKVACPLCSADARRWMEKSGYPIYACQSCKLAFVHPLPQSTNEVYGEDYFAGAEGGHGYVDYDKDKEPMVPVFEEYVRRLQKLGATGTLLDVGAATGFFVAIANRMGFVGSGVEISPFAAQVGRSKGLDIKTGVLAEVGGTYDVVTMLDLIEHVPNPHDELVRAHTLLKPGGYLVINTPDAGSLYAKVMGKRWHLIVPPEHLYYFDRQNMQTLLTVCGFETVVVTTIGKSFTLAYIFKTLYAWQKFPLWKWLGDFSQRYLPRFALPINLRDNMFLIAKKR